MQQIKHNLINIFTSVYPMAKRWLHNFHGGVYPQAGKDLSLRQPLRAPFIPTKLILPLRQNRGAPAIPLVQVGDKVKKYQLIARASEGLSVPIHAPTSGEIIAIEAQTVPHQSGLAEVSIVIKTDGLDQAIDNALQLDLQQQNYPAADLKKLLQTAGIVGLGGAGFPTFAKLPDQPGLVKHLIINGAECEPFITCDDLLMQTHPAEILIGAAIVAEAFGIPNIIAGIENNKPKAIAAMQKSAKTLQNHQIKIESVPTVYPIGGQKQLIQQLLNLEVPADKHTIDIGIVMLNVATCRAIYQAVNAGKPLVSRFITVSGLGLHQPYNIEALLGTPFNELAELAQPKVTLDYPLIMGGPMMGFEVPTNQVPVIKTTNCILANPPEPAEMVMPCIRCTQCSQACPVNLLPQQMYWHAHAGEYEKTLEYNIFDCIECGACSFVCPSHIPLVQYYRHAKSELRNLQALEQLTEQAKVRFEAREARLEREKQEREARLAARKAEVKKAAQQTAEQTSAVQPAAGAMSARERAIAAAKARQQATAPEAVAETTTSSEAGETSAADKRQAAMAAAKARAAARKAEQSQETE